MGTSLRNRLCTFQAFSALYQVKQVPKSRETRFKLVCFFELTGGDRAQMLKFIALPFPFSSRLKLWSYHVGGRQRNVQKNVMHVQSCCFVNLTLSRFGRCRCHRRSSLLNFALLLYTISSNFGYTSLPSPGVNINFGETILFVACRSPMMFNAAPFVSWSGSGHCLGL